MRQEFLWTVPVNSWLTGSSWQASEGPPYADPPWLFNPAEMSGGVYGFLTAAGHYSCPLDPGQPWAVVSDDEMESVRRAAPLARA